MIKYRLFNAFVKITGIIPQSIIFRTKIYYQDKKVQSRKIKGPAIIISNHTSVFDYAVILFVFYFRTLRYQMAELLFRRRGLRVFLKYMGGIFVDRNSTDYSFIDKSKEILEKKSIVGIFPEGRIPRANEIPPIEFKSSAVKLALETGVPIIPLYTDGVYFKKKRARVIIGKPIYVGELYKSDLDYKANLQQISESLRNKIIELRELMEEKQNEEKSK